MAGQTPDGVFGFTNSGAVSHQGTVSIDVDSNDQFYLAMGLMAAARGNGAMAESLSTLSASFDGNPALIPVITTVPLPPAFFLFGSGILALIGLSRRKKALV